MAPSAAATTHVVAALVTDEVSLSELGQAGDVFRAVNTATAAAPPAYDVVVCAPVPGPIRSREGFDLQVPGMLDTVMRADTVLLPGCWPVGVPSKPDVLDALRTAHRRGARIVATCTGVSVAAAAGLLDGRTATTHWRHAEAFMRAHPQVHLQSEVLYLDHGDVATSAGTSAGLDLYLHLIRRDHGAEIAAAVARRLISPRQRDGHQPQLLPDPLPQRQDQLADVLQHLAAHLQDREPIAAVARRMGLSERTLRRRFHDQIGATPGQWILTERLRHAQRLLETTDLPVETIAHSVGLASATALRRQFRRELAMTPTEHRRLHRSLMTSAGTIGIDRSTV